MRAFAARGVKVAIDRGVATCSEERSRFDAVLARIDEKLSRLSEMRSRLVAQLAQCERDECGLLAYALLARSPAGK